MDPLARSMWGSTCVRLSLGTSNVSTLFFVSGGPFAGRVRASPRFSGPNCRVQLFNYQVRGPRRGPVPFPGPRTSRPEMRVHSYGKNTVDTPSSAAQVHPQSSETIPVCSRLEDSLDRRRADAARGPVSLNFDRHWDFDSRYRDFVCLHRAATI